MRLWATMIKPEVDRCSKKAGFRRSSRPGAGRPDRSLRMSRPAWHARSGATHPHLTPINCRRVASFYAAAQSLSRLWSGKAPPPRCDFAGARRLTMLPWTPPPRFGNFSKPLPACRAISARSALCSSLDTHATLVSGHPRRWFLRVGSWTPIRGKAPGHPCAPCARCRGGSRFVIERKVLSAWLKAAGSTIQASLRRRAWRSNPAPTR